VLSCLQQRGKPTDRHNKDFSASGNYFGNVPQKGSYFANRM